MKGSEEDLKLDDVGEIVSVVDAVIWKDRENLQGRDDWT